MAKQNTIKSNESLKYVDSQESTSGKPILCKLYGPVADVVKPTRNGRKYSNELWKKVFKDPMVIEAFESGGILIEANHPEGRIETDLEKVAAIMPKVPVENKDGLLEAEIHVLDTPNGRIIDTLARYGYKLGISSRGDGEIITDYDGQESVDPNSFQLSAWDFVVTPAVKEARLSILESVQGKSLKQALNENLKKATNEERRIMTETLDALKIKYDNIAADDVGATIVKELQESLLKQQTQEAQILELQEKLSVCYAKEANQDEQLSKYRVAIKNLTESVNNMKVLKTNNEALTKKLEIKDKLLKEAINKAENISRKLDEAIKNKTSLNESIGRKQAEVNKANKVIKTLNENLNNLQKTFEDEKHMLNENIASIKKDLQIKTNEYIGKLSKTNKLVEQYKQTAKTAVNKYIESKAIMMGMTSDEIKNKLPKEYSFNDIDSVCEDLSKYKLRTNSLPFEVSRQRVSVNESKKDPIVPKDIFDDTIDESLYKLANMN